MGPHGSQNEAWVSGGRGRSCFSAHMCQDQAMALLMANLPTMGTLQLCFSSSLLPITALALLSSPQPHRRGVEASGRGAEVGTPRSLVVCGRRRPALTPGCRHLLVSRSETNSGSRLAAGPQQPRCAGCAGSSRNPAEAPSSPALRHGASPCLPLGAWQGVPAHQLLLSTLKCPPCVLMDCRMSFPIGKTIKMP